MRYLSNNSNGLKEAFRPGTAKFIYQKIIRILSRRMHLRFSYAETPVPIYFKHPTLGKLAGFLFMHPSGKKMYRLNFNLGKSDQIVSIDVFNDFLHLIPTYTVDLKGFNIVQVLDLVCDVLSGAYFDYAKDIELTEVNHNDVVKAWLESNRSMMDAIRSGNFDLNTLYANYASYSQDVQHKKPCVPGAFRWNLGAALNKLGIRVEIPTITVTPGVRTIAIVNNQQEQEFEDEVINNEHIITFEYMRHTMERMKMGDKYVKNVYIYGVGGIGKSKSAIDILGRLPNFVLQKSPIRGAEGLLQFLFENREGKIIVMDDCIKSEDMKNGQIENILKAAMDSDEPRWIKIARRTPRNASANSRPNRITEEPEFIDLVNFNSDDGVGDDETMWRFQFKSNIVFITNIPYIPEAIGDRCVTIAMNFNKDQILDIIKAALENFEPDVPMEDKVFVWEWLNENKVIARKISFRVFSNVLGMYLSGKNAPGDKWQQFAKLMLKSAMAPNY